MEALLHEDLPPVVTRLVERCGLALLAFLSALASLAYLPVAVVDAWRRRMR